MTASDISPFPLSRLILFDFLQFIRASEVLPPSLGSNNLIFIAVSSLRQQKEREDDERSLVWGIVRLREVYLLPWERREPGSHRASVQRPWVDRSYMANQ